MKTAPLNRDNRAYYVGRLAAIQTPGQRRWGRLSPASVMCHLRFTVEAPIDEGENAPDWSVPVLRRAVYHVFFRWLTRWPGGVMKAPATLTPEPEGDVAAEREALIRAMARFIDLLEEEPERKLKHIVLGPLPLREFAQVHGVHFRHHLRQFGVD